VSPVIRGMQAGETTSGKSPPGVLTTSPVGVVVVACMAAPSGFVPFAPPTMRARPISAVDLRYDFGMTGGGDLLQVADVVLGAGGWISPSAVSIGDGHLQWERGGTAVEAPGDLIDRFARLRSADSASLESFAARWGVLFGIPDDRGHGDNCAACFVASGGAVSIPSWYRVDFEHGSESLDAWRRLAADVVGSLEVAAAYHRDGYVDTSVWRSFGNLRIEVVDQPGGEWVSTSLPSRSAQLALSPPTTGWNGADGARFIGPPAQAIGTFADLLLDGVRLRTRMSPDGPSAQLEPFGLLGAIGLQLMQKICGTAALALCAGCREPFAPKRKPVQGRRSWCERCKESGVPQRQAARDYRAGLGVKRQRPP
jgi:hypothetical protein